MVEVGRDTRTGASQIGRKSLQCLRGRRKRRAGDGGKKSQLSFGALRHQSKAHELTAVCADTTRAAGGLVGFLDGEA